MFKSRRTFSRVQELIEQKLSNGSPNWLVVTNDSWMHKKGTETHFRVDIVSDAFRGMSDFERQAQVHKELSEVWKEGVYGLSVSAKTPEEVSK